MSNIIPIIGGNGSKPPTDLDFKRCPLCHQNQTMMEKQSALSMDGQTFHCVQCEEDFSTGYLVPFWRGFTSGRGSTQQMIQEALMERASANRMIWAVAYAGEGHQVQIEDATMALAGDPSIIIEAHRKPEEMATVVMARFANKKERQQMGLPEGDGEEKKPEK